MANIKLKKILKEDFTRTLAGGIVTMKPLNQISLSNIVKEKYGDANEEKVDIEGLKQANSHQHTDFTRSFNEQLTQTHGDSIKKENRHADDSEFNYDSVKELIIRLVNTFKKSNSKFTGVLYVANEKKNRKPLYDVAITKKDVIIYIPNGTNLTRHQLLLHNFEHRCNGQPCNKDQVKRFQQHFLQAMKDSSEQKTTVLALLD